MCVSNEEKIKNSFVLYITSLIKRKIMNPKHAVILQVNLCKGNNSTYCRWLTYPLVIWKIQKWCWENGPESVKCPRVPREPHPGTGHRCGATPSYTSKYRAIPQNWARSAERVLGRRDCDQISVLEKMHQLLWDRNVSLTVLCILDASSRLVEQLVLVHWTGQDEAGQKQQWRDG